MIQQVTKCSVRDLGLINYAEAYELQKQCVSDFLEGGPQSLLLCEHPSVLTLGRLADEKNVLITREELVKHNVSIYPIDRGGDITLHAPGQLVIYPILNLADFGKDLRRYLHQLEQVTIDLLGGFDIVASRIPGKTGAWIGEKKIASIGIGVRKWVSFHGLAINVNTDLELFSMIRPCGLNVEMISMERIKGKKVDLKEVKQKMTECFRESFQLDLI